MIVATPNGIIQIINITKDVYQPIERVEVKIVQENRVIISEISIISKSKL